MLRRFKSHVLFDLLVQIEHIWDDIKNECTYTGFREFRRTSTNTDAGIGQSPTGCSLKLSTSYASCYRWQKRTQSLQKTF